MNYGIYFSASDAVLEWTYAFLNSFRESNPALPLFLIPFNSDCESILNLRHEYDFEVYRDSSFAELERIGEDYELGHTPHGRYWFRRFAAFWGPLDKFMYLDARQLVLTDLTPLVQASDRYGFDLLHFDCALDQVYQPSPLRLELLKQGRARGFNSGRWASRRGVFTLVELRKFADESLRNRDQLNPRNTDQAFLNYCCDMKPIRYGRFSDVMGDVCPDGWARQPGHVYRKDNAHFLWDHGGLSHQKKVVLIHWAGISSRPTMPHRRLYLKYRHLRASWCQKRWAGTTDLIRLPFYWSAESLRTNRWCNQAYHLYRNIRREASRNGLEIDPAKTRLASGTATEIDPARLPNVVSIGGQRCGSSWLQAFLQDHPEVFFASKEPAILNRVIREKGLNAAYEFFKDSHGFPIRMEETPTYSAMFPEEVRAVRDILPGLKVVFTVRHPVDRICSSITHSRSCEHLPTEKAVGRSRWTVLRLAENGLTRRLTDYAWTYRSWVEVFGEDQVFLARFEQIRESPYRLCQDLCRFIGVGDLKTGPDILTRTRNFTKSGISIDDPFVLWYVARRWLRPLRRFQAIAPIDVSDWVADLQHTIDSGKLIWRFYAALFQLFYLFPYRFAYTIAQWIRRPLRHLKLRRQIRKIGVRSCVATYEAGNSSRAA